MKHIKMYVLGVVLLIGLHQLQAQNKPGNRGQRFQKSEKMNARNNAIEFAKELNLTDEQKAKVKTINEEFRTKAKALKDNDKLTMGEYKTQMAALQKERKEKLEAVLTPEQKQKAKELRQKNKEKKEANSDARIKKMQENLNLSDAQVSKIKEQNSTFNTKAKAIRDNTSLTPAEKKQQLVALNKERKDAVKSILTKEQLEKQASFKHKEKAIR